jgi:hypothetical protein
MGKQRSSFAKLQRDRAKAAKKAAKQAARQGNTNDPFGPAPTADLEGGSDVEVMDDAGSSIVSELLEGKGELTAPELLELIEAVHKQLENGDITPEEFEDAKVEIFARLPID